MAGTAGCKGGGGDNGGGGHDDLGRHMGLTEELVVWFAFCLTEVAD